MNRAHTIWKSLWHPKDSREYEVLSYRIRCGQLYQQNEIDKAKGVVCKPMPKVWHDRHEVNRMDDQEMKELYRAIVADKKPYFMRYIYPALMKQYNTYIKNTNRNALREFQMTVVELERIPDEELTDRQREFLKYYRIKMPVGTGPCVMNRICKRFEDRFDGYIGKHNTKAQFDYRVLRSDAEYLQKQYNSIRKLLEEYNKKIANYVIFADYERVDEYETFATLSMMDREFRRECICICPNSKELCNIVLDLCYTKASTKRFCWKISGDEIIRNLLDKNRNVISYPALDPDGEVLFGGKRYTVRTKEIGVTEDGSGTE